MDAIKILGSLMGNNAVSSSLGAQVLKGLLSGGSGGSSGGLGALLGSALGGGGSGSGPGILGDLAEAALQHFAQGNRTTAPSVPEGMKHDQANRGAEVLIRAMINAAKADGRVDSAEQEHILKRLGDDIDEQEAEFLRREFARPLAVRDFVREVPPGMEQQVYAISVLAIDLDTHPEAEYLHALAQGLRIAPETSNRIHEQLGAPPLYSGT